VFLVAIIFLTGTEFSRKGTNAAMCHIKSLGASSQAGEMSVVKNYGSRGVEEFLWNAKLAYRGQISS